MVGLSSLRILHAGHNQLVSIQSGLLQIYGLEELYLSHNCICGIPAGIASLQLLTTLHLADNSIGILPFELSSLRYLVNFDAANNPISNIPATVLENGSHFMQRYMMSMHDTSQSCRLALSGIGLQEVPLHVLGLTSLTVLKLDKNELTAIPASIGRNLPELRVLDVSFNKISRIPASVCCLSVLEELALLGNPVSVFPFGMAAMTALRHLRVDVTKMTDELCSPPAHLFSRGTQVVMEFMQRFNDAKVSGLLDLVGYGLQHVPIEALEELDPNIVKSVVLSENHLAVIPRWFERLVHLHELQLESNAFDRIDLSMVTRLVELNLSDNRLTSLPDNLSCLVSLTGLSVDYNRYVYLAVW